MSDMEAHNYRMYHEFAHFWKLVSPPEDYENEASFWLKALREKLGPGQYDLLELGVGGGNNLSFIKKGFNATAVDQSEEMLAQCRKINPDVELHQGDMRTVRLGRKFNAVVIHDAISYMQTEDDLRQVFETVAAHLEPGGVFVTSPDYFRETFAPPRVNHGTNSDGTTEFTNIEYQWDPDPADTTYEAIMFFMIRSKEGLKIEQDRHVFGLFPLQAWLDLMTKAGFTAETQDYPVHEGGIKGYLLVGVLK
jgi:SAM-dependent methyltransferase